MLNCHLSLLKIIGNRCNLFFLSLLLMLGCKTSSSPFPISNDVIKIDTIATDFSIPYGIAILGENEYYISDRIGKFYHFKQGQLTTISGLPKVLTYPNPGFPIILHGGLMDISLHPNFATNGWIYSVFLNPKGICEVVRFKIKNNQAVQLSSIFATRTAGYYGNGARIVWQDDSHFFLNIGGSTGSTITRPKLRAQDLAEDWGKIHRLKEDGSIPTDNPILEGFNAPISIWSYGHRDAQGLYYDDLTKVLFACEHGPKGGDEFNIIEKGGNYGWPLFSHGIDYGGEAVSTISKDSAATFSILAEHYWTVPTSDGGQAIAPACLLKVANSNIPEWNNHFLIGSLAFKRLLKYNRETGKTMGLNVTGRVRTIKQLPSGDMIALIERTSPEQSNGKIVRISVEQGN